MINRDRVLKLLRDLKEWESDEFFEFYGKYRRLRNRLAHRYKMPSDEELLLNLKNNFKGISELEKAIKELAK